MTVCAPVAQVLDIYTVESDIALGRTATGAPTNIVTVTTVIATDDPLDARLTATQFALWFAGGQMPVADRIVNLVC